MNLGEPDISWQFVSFLLWCIMILMAFAVPVAVGRIVWICTRSRREVTKGAGAVAAAMAIVLGVAACGSLGCQSSNASATPAPVSVDLIGEYPVTSTQTVAVAVGIRDIIESFYGGEPMPCPGADVDAQMVKRWCAVRGIDCALILNRDATRLAVMEATRAQCAKMKNDFRLLFTISGHGGDRPDLNGDEPNGRDSTWCMADGEWLDDHVWLFLLDLKKDYPLLKEILPINDQCHAESSFRGFARSIQQGVSFGYWGKKHAKVLRGTGGSLDLVIAQFAGCRQPEYSYGTKRGGTWTQALDSAIKAQTVQEWFDQALPFVDTDQVPVLVTHGDASGMLGTKALR